MRKSETITTSAEQIANLRYEVVFVLKATRNFLMLKDVSLNENERRSAMKLIYSLFLLFTLGLLVKDVSASRAPLFSAAEMREVNLRLNSIRYL